MIGFLAGVAVGFLSTATLFTLFAVFAVAAEQND